MQISSGEWKAREKSWEFFRIQQLNPKIKKLIRKRKTDFERKLSDNIKPNNKSFYEYINRKKEAEERCGTSREWGWWIITENKDMLHLFLASVCTVEDTANIPHITDGLLSNDRDLLVSFQMTRDKVLEKCSGLEADKSGTQCTLEV